MKEIIKKVKEMLLANVKHAIPYWDDCESDESDRCARFNDTGFGVEEYEDIECTCGYDEKVKEVLAVIEELMNLIFELEEMADDGPGI